ncbi:putative feruloyl esterase [Helianthus annuus]|nr:putative feruloyl esterase [Helianthus annuus]KAJ0673506.1 putative feruloyl esterase [Helianthus annuus]
MYKIINYVQTLIPHIIIIITTLRILLKQGLPPINNHSDSQHKQKTMAAGDSTTTIDQNPGVEQHEQKKRIVIQNKCGEKLVGLLHETRSKEIVILCHGFRDSKEYSMMVELAFALEKHGISAFRFDFSGNGESEGLFQFGNYSKEVDDLHAVTQHFTAENRVVSAIIGHSKGGNVVVLYASLHHDVHTVINVSGRYKMDRGIEERLGKDYMERVKKDGFIDVHSKTGLTIYNYEFMIVSLGVQMSRAARELLEISSRKSSKQAELSLSLIKSRLFIEPDLEPSM